MISTIETVHGISYPIVNDPGTGETSNDADESTQPSLTRQYRIETAERIEKSVRDARGIAGERLSR